MTENESDQLKCQASNIRLDALEAQINSMKQDNKEFYNRIRELERIGAVQAERYDNILQKLDGVADSVEALNAAPGKRWNSAVDKVVFTIIGAVVAFILAQIGLN